MVKRRAFLTLLMAALLAASASTAFAAPRAAGPLAKTTVITERVPTAIDGSMASLILFMRDRLTIAYRTLRGPGIVDGPFVGTDNELNGVTEGPTGVDPLGAKGTIHGPTPAQSRLPGM